VLCSYEFVSVAHRRILKRAFGVPVFDLYGATETGHLLMENDRGEMVPSCETACLEVVETGKDGIGSLIVTTLTNDYMPLLRYRIGDLVERREHADRATYALHGREADALATPGGGRVTIFQMDQCFAGLAGFTHYQMVQTAEAEWQLRYVPDLTPPRPANLAELRRRLCERLGTTKGLDLRPTEFLLPENSGKFRLSYPLPPASA
jgi:phenylacetate-CoA ligase